MNLPVDFTAPDRSRVAGPAPHLLAALGWLVLAGLGVGALTSWAQGVLPDALAPLANSSSGWTVATALVVSATRPRPLRGACFGLVGFLCLLIGYTVASRMRGLFYDPLFWAVVAVFAGPVVGAATAALLSRRPLTVALGSGVLAGVLVGDGIYGLTVVAETTSPVYWTGALIAGLVLILVTAFRWVRVPAAVAVQVATFVATTGVVTLGYAVIT